MSLKKLPLILFTALSFILNAQKNHKQNYLNPKLDIDTRLDLLMAQMSLEDKVYQMNQFVGIEHMKKAEKDLTEADLANNDTQGFYKGVFSKDVEAMTKAGKIGSFLHVLTPEEANYLQKLAAQSPLKIPLLIGIDAIHGNALVSGTTVYPSPITLASTWNNELLYDVGKQTALEMRATGSHWTFTPNIDVMRDPRWGRVGETFGEDPFLVGELGSSMIKGFQDGNLNTNEKVIACAKHMIAGGEPINGLNASPMDVSLRTLKEIHLPPYKKAVDAGVYSIMAAHNELNGIPCHMSKWLMTDLIRNEWGFEGFFVSDWMDIERIETLHHVARSLKEASKYAVEAGMDMHMHGVKFPEAVIALVNEGKLSEDRVNDACRKILKAKFMLGLFENSTVNLKQIPKKINTKTHRDKALETARKGVVLLKNNAVLPLKPTKDKTILVTGPNANNQTTLGDWHWPQPDENVITIYEGIKAIGEKKGYNVNYFNSGENIRKITSKHIEQTVAKAREADITIVVVGDNSMRNKWKDKTAGENMARARLDLAGNQLKLIQDIKNTNTQLIVVLVNGKPIAEPWLKDNVPALIEAWEPGLLGGQAVGEIIFGEINPSGKLPLTVPRSVGQLQMVYNHKPSQYFHKYAFEKIKPLYPFGYGLSYSSFAYGTPRLAENNLENNGTVIFQIPVTNTSKLDGEEVVQLYIRDLYSSATRPVKELKAYERVFIKAGETITVSFELTAESFAFYNRSMDYIVEPGVFRIMIGPSSENKTLKTLNFKVNETITF